MKMVAKKHRTLSFAWPIITSSKNQHDHFIHFHQCPLCEHPITVGDAIIIGYPSIDSKTCACESTCLDIIFCHKNNYIGQ